MLSNKYLGFTTFGESHGFGFGLVIEDVIPNIDFPFDALKTTLQKRKPNQSTFTTQRNETDDFEVISGLFKGKTTGLPICILFKNNDIRTSDYDFLENTFRPAHADEAWFKKFKIYDYRGGGRASGRETISRVAAGAYVQSLLGDIKITAYPIQIYNIHAIKKDLNYISSNPLCWPCPETYSSVTDLLEKIASERDSVGGVVEVKIEQVPSGLGDPVFEKLDGNLSKAIMSIGGVKGIEFGEGFSLSNMKGSHANNNSKHGGIFGGVSNGDDIVMKIAVKPVPSIGLPGRHDVCLIPRILPVIVSMIQLVLSDAIAHQRLISCEQPNLSVLREAIDKIDEDILIALFRRAEVVKQIKVYKTNNKLAIHDNQREKLVMDNVLDLGGQLGLNSAFVNDIYDLIIGESKRMQGSPQD